MLFYFLHVILKLQNRKKKFFLPSHMACRILVPWVKIEPRATAMKALSPNHRTTRELPTKVFLKQLIYFKNQQVNKMSTHTQMA